MTLSEQSNESASNFTLSLNIPLQKLFGWFRMLQLWVTGDWQLHHNNVPAHASRFLQSFLAKHQIIQVTQPHYSLDLVPFDFWLFPKFKSPLKGKRFQTINEIQEIWWGSWWCFQQRILQSVLKSGRNAWKSVTKTTRLLMHHISGRVFWWNIKSPRWLSPAKVQIWHTATSGFSKN